MNGTWNLTVHTYMGDMRSIAEYVVDGNKLTGFVTDASNGAKAPIENGVVNGNEISYTLTIKTAVGEMTNELKLALVDGVLKGSSKNPMGEFEADGVRA